MSTPMTPKPALLYPMPAPAAQQERSRRRGLLLLAPSIGQGDEAAHRWQSILKLSNFGEFFAALFLLSLEFKMSVFMSKCSVLFHELYVPW